MSYLRNCTHCISLLKNCKKTKDAKFSVVDGIVLIEVEKKSIANIIEQLENHQLASFTLYNILLEKENEEA